jgi:hypothetical protein
VDVLSTEATLEHKTRGVSSSKVIIIHSKLVLEEQLFTSLRHSLFQAKFLLHGRPSLLISTSKFFEIHEVWQLVVNILAVEMI